MIKKVDKFVLSQYWSRNKGLFLAVTCKQEPKSVELD